MPGLVTLREAGHAAIAEPLFLTFVNTLHWDDGVPLEEFVDAEALAAWCRDQELPTDALEGQFTPLLTLREHARAIVERLARGQTPLGPDLEAINQILGHPTGQLTLVDADSAQPSICFQAHRDDRAGVAFRVALSLAQFLVAGDRRRLKLCANPGCGYAFLDTSNNGSRRWCDMRACGNRHKVRTFRRRRHAARPASTPGGLSRAR